MAQRIVVQVFGDRAFARKATKTSPGLRAEIGLRSTVPPFTVRVVGRGETWMDAVIDAGHKLRLPDVVQTATELKAKYADQTPA